ncbi:alpha 1,2 mannosyltransferase, partial [Kickxella alabastrina]
MALWPSPLQLLYGALLLTRLLFSLSPSYIHPDEYLQTGEIAANDLLHTSAYRTWEFTTSQPIRSILPLYLISGPPTLLLRLLPPPLSSMKTSQTLFIAQRLHMFALSLLVDLSVFRMVRRKTRWLAVVVLASSHCVAVFHVHAFSNSLASETLALALWVFSRARWSLLGALLVLGTFAHVSFAMFALPLGVGALARARGHAAARLALGAAPVLLAMVTADSVYYGRLVCTVWNNLRYNSNTGNLAAHGIHPWYLHLAVSMPALYGPLYAVFGVKLLCMWRRRMFGAIAAWSVISGVGVLSLVPHQEPRFVMPAVSAMVVFTADCFMRVPRSGWMLWAGFNLALAAVYGGVHQAGVIPTVAYLAESSVLDSVQCSPAVGALGLRDNAVVRCGQRMAGESYEAVTHVLAYKTFILPRHLLLQPEKPQQLLGGEFAGGRVVVRDL